MPLGTSRTQRGMYRGIRSSMLRWAPIVRTTAVNPHTRSPSLSIEKHYERNRTMHRSVDKYSQPLVFYSR